MEPAVARDMIKGAADPLLSAFYLRYSMLLALARVEVQPPPSISGALAGLCPHLPHTPSPQRCCTPYACARSSRSCWSAATPCPPSLRPHPQSLQRQLHVCACACRVPARRRCWVLRFASSSCAVRCPS